MISGAPADKYGLLTCQVVVGTLNRNSNGVRYNIDKCIENFTTRDPRPALIRTSTNIIFNDFVYPICLPPTDLCLAPGSEVWTSGHGSDNYGKPYNPFGWSDEDTLLYEKLYLKINEEIPELRRRTVSTETPPSWYWLEDPGSPLHSWFQTELFFVFKLRYLPTLVYWQLE